MKHTNQSEIREKIGFKNVEFGVKKLYSSEY